MIFAVLKYSWDISNVHGFPHRTVNITFSFMPSPNSTFLEQFDMYPHASIINHEVG